MEDSVKPLAPLGIDGVPDPDTTRSQQLIEQRSIDYVPEDERHGKVWKQGPFWFLANFSFFSVALGFIGPSMGLSLGWTVLGGALGAVFGALAMAFHASQGPALGLPQMVQSRAQFGYFGVLIPVVVTVFVFIGFSTVQTNVLQTGFQGIFGWNPVLTAALVSAGAALLSVLGHDWLHRSFRILFWCSIPFYGALSIAMMTGGVQSTTPVEGGFRAAAFMAVFATAASYNITLAPDIANFTRYLPVRTKTSHLVLAVVGGTCLALVWMMAMGAWLATRTGATDALVSLNDTGNEVFGHLGTTLAVLSALALTATIGINTYSAVLSAITIIDCFRPQQATYTQRIVWSVIVIAVSFVASINISGNQLTSINDLMNGLLYLLVPWSSINLVDFFFVRRGHYSITDMFRPNGIYGRYAWRGLTAYAVGLAVEIPFVVFSFYAGPLATAFHRIDVAFIIGAIVPAVFYLFVSRGLDLEAEAAAAANNPAH
ncbi:purine-cytosine permease family protein [Streptomyces chartreusis]|uniref:purine-cytosine permease family protein n=1 Tax=Streptomyces chartreusis TaxID=1969 RepID=UPI0036AE2C57